MLVGVALLLGAASLAGDGRRFKWIRSRLPEQPRECPPATVIVPVKGEDEGLGANLAALAALDYPDYELIVVARAETDIPAGVAPERARVLIAGEGDAGNGEKVNNLLAAVAAARDDAEVLAFADSDGKVRPGWLRALVRALEDDHAGAATAYRWHLPDPAGFWPLLRSVWNAVVAGNYGPGQNRFAWGGAMAIRREMFERLDVAGHWRGSLSDDQGLSAAVKQAGLLIVYAPGAIVVSSDQTGALEFLRWIERQLIIVKVYSPRLWGAAFATHIVYCAAMVISTTFALQGNLTGLYTLIAQLSLGFARGARRLRVARRCLPEYSEWFRRYGWVHVWWTPLATWVWLYSFLASARTSTIDWRGNRYRLTAGRVEKL